MFCLSGPTICGPVKNSDENDDSLTELPLFSLLGDDAYVFDDMWKDLRKLPDMKTGDERSKLISNNFKKLHELREKWDKEERIRKEERSKSEEEYFRIQQQPIDLGNPIHRFERKRWYQTLFEEHEQRFESKKWYQILFDVSLPGQLYSLTYMHKKLYSLYSYLKS